MHELSRSDPEIDDLLNAVMDKIDEGGSKFEGMTFEEGVRDALLWVTGQTTEHPYEE